jgi:cyclic-di-GMP-binding protein
MVWSEKMPSFDIVSKVPWNEVDNALNQAQKEVAQRFDFRGTGAAIEKIAEGITIRASTDDRVKAALDVLEEKLVKRKVSLKHLERGKLEVTSKGGSKMLVKILEGIDIDHARTLVKWIKDEKLKVVASIQEQQVRVSGKKKDDLQTTIAALRAKEFDLELQFINFRE